MFKSVIFETPFGTHLETSYGELAYQLVDQYPCTTLWTLETQVPLLYVQGEYQRRGCFWWDGTAFGSTFPSPRTTWAFFPHFKSRYRGVPPFILYGFAQGLSPVESFVVCQLCVWRDRGLLSVSQEDCEFLLRRLLARLVDNQPAPFLKERRIRLAEFLSLPQSLRARRKLTDSGVDLYVVDAFNRNWRVWCPFWLDT